MLDLISYSSSSFSSNILIINSSFKPSNSTFIYLITYKLTNLLLKFRITLFLFLTLNLSKLASKPAFSISNKLTLTFKLLKVLVTLLNRILYIILIYIKSFPVNLIPRS